MCQPPTPVLRVYPVGFANEIFRLWSDTSTRPRADVRNKLTLDPSKTDRQLFDEMDSHDIWVDSRIVETFLYLVENKNCVVPLEWQDSIRRFHAEMAQWVPRLN